MVEFLITMALGIILCVIGIINMTGNVSSLHWYHRQRVSEENRKPFGRLVGLGTIIIGASIALFSGLCLVAETMQNDVFMIVGVIELIVGVVSGLSLNFYAMIKYNKGIF